MSSTPQNNVTLTEQVNHDKHAEEDLTDELSPSITYQELPERTPDYRTDINIWPYPQSYVVTGKNQSFIIVNWKEFKFLGSKNAILQDAFARYKVWTFHKTGIPSISCKNSNCVMGLTVRIQNENEAIPHVDMDESYELILDPNRKMFFLNSKSVWGALRGLETFSQMVVVDKNQYMIAETPVTIKDSPRFKWRGLLLDTSRHFLPTSAIIRTLNSMSFNKMNVFHWHITDAHSFPIFIKEFPKLKKYGTFRKDAFYSHTDIRGVVEHARKLGIRVIMEMDVPGHTHSWGLHYPITSKCPPKLKDINLTPLNPAVNMTYDVIKAVFDTTFRLCPDQFIHLGADEIEKMCWSVDEKIKKFMKERKWHGRDGYDHLQAHFFTKIEPLYRKHKKIPIVWEDLLITQKHYKLPKDMIIQAWKSRESSLNALSLGYKTILSHGFYLDMQTPTDSPGIARTYRYRWLDTWKDFYENEPFRLGDIPEVQKKNFLGGEAAMWTEQVDELNLDSSIWPRTSAIAERLWSPRNVNVTRAARWRLNSHRCMMVRRGISAAPAEPDFIGKYCDAKLDRN